MGVSESVALYKIQEYNINIIGTVYISLSSTLFQSLLLLYLYLYLFTARDRSTFMNCRLLGTKSKNILSLFGVNLHPESTEQSAQSRALSWTTSTSLTCPQVQPKTLWDLDLVRRPHTRWVCLFALTALLTLHPFINTVTITESTDGDYMLPLCSHKPSPFSSSSSSLDGCFVSLLTDISCCW